MKKILKVVMATALMMSATPTMLVPYAAVVQQVPARTETEADGSSMTSAQKIAPISISSTESAAETKAAADSSAAAGTSASTGTSAASSKKAGTEAEETAKEKAGAETSSSKETVAAKSQTAAAAQMKTAAQVEAPSTAAAATSSSSSGTKTESEIVSAAAKSDYDNIAISQVSGYVNVRSTASTSGAVVGKLYNNAAADILSTVDGEDGKWYQIKSGNVSGYTKAEYFITGSEAAEKASQIGTNVAKVAVSTKLNLRSEPNTTSTVLDSLDPGSEYEVVGEESGFYKIQVDNDLTGYVSKDYITLSTQFKTALTNDEEQAAADSAAEREQAAKAAISTLNEAHEESRAAETAAAETTKAETTASETAKAKSSSATTAAETKSSSKSSVSGPGSSSSSGSTSSVGEKVATATRSAIVAYAKQFLGNPYVYGGTSLTEGCDCSGFTQQIYKHFGITTGRSSRDQAEKGKDIDIDDIQPGDLLFYSNGNSINHVAMYIGDGQIIHSSTPKSGIKISSYDYRTPVKAVTFLNK